MKKDVLNALFFAFLSIGCIAVTVMFIEGVTYSQAQAAVKPLPELPEPKDAQPEPQQSEPEPEPEPVSKYIEYEPVYEVQAPTEAYMPSDGLNAYTGVNYHDGRRETYYSSNVLYHQNTPDWTLDSEGFYRTDEGYYVVAASDKPQGSTFEGSKGTCVVLDTGCPDGVTDYYVGW